MLLFIVIFCAIVALGFCMASAWSDWNGMVIPNVYPAGVLLSFVIAYGATYALAPDITYFSSLKSHLIALGAIFGVTFILFSLRMIGAGDSKLAAVVALWVGLEGLMTFLFFMGIVGGLLGLVALYIQKAKPAKEPSEGSFVDRVQKGESAVPYGIAIAIGAIVAFYMVGYFDPENLTVLANGESMEG